MITEKNVDGLNEKAARVLRMYNGLSENGKEKVIALLGLLLTAEYSDKNDKCEEDNHYEE